MPRGAVVLPVIANQVVIAYNLPASGAAPARAVYPKIFSGAIESWNDPGHRRGQPGRRCRSCPSPSSSAPTPAAPPAPSRPPERHRRRSATVGAARSPKWPEGERFVREDGNDGVAAALIETRGSIGYMEHGYAQLADWRQLALLENRAGEFVAPGRSPGWRRSPRPPCRRRAAPRAARRICACASDRPERRGAYPIIALTWLLFHAAGYDTRARDAVLGLIRLLHQRRGPGHPPLPTRPASACSGAGSTAPRRRWPSPPPRAGDDGRSSPRCRTCPRRGPARGARLLPARRATCRC
jgi:phosphate transport system substrate-binding protein